MAFKTLMGALVALPLAATALADPGHSHGDVRAYGEPGNPKKTSRTVQVVMREADGKMEFVPSKIEIRRGEQIKFVLKNDGALDHELVIGTLEENLKHAIEMQKNPDMEHDDPNAKRLAPGKGGDSRPPGSRHVGHHCREVVASRTNLSQTGEDNA